MFGAEVPLSLSILAFERFYFFHPLQCFIALSHCISLSLLLESMSILCDSS